MVDRPVKDRPDKGGCRRSSAPTACRALLLTRDCDRDSGSPMITTYFGQPAVIGILSWGRGSGVKDKSDVGVPRRNLRTDESVIPPCGIIFGWIRTPRPKRSPLRSFAI